MRPPPAQSGRLENHICTGLAGQYYSNSLDMARGSENRLVDGLVQHAQQGCGVKLRPFNGTERIELFGRYQVY